MNVLLIEDDNNKAKNIQSQLKGSFPSFNISLKRSAQSGTAAALSADYHLLLLDMSLPQYDIGPGEDGYEFNFFAGREILFELVRNEIKLPTLVITQFETFGEGSEITSLSELDRQLQKEFSEIYIGCIYYSASRSDWKRELDSKLKKYG